MKNGYKHKTGIFGNAAESYVSRILMLMKNPNGHRRPDLISINETYEPILSVEVKSGRQMKGVLVDYQLHYAITTEQAYIELFGESPPKRELNTELFPNDKITAKNRLLPGNSVAYYYCVIDRKDKLTSEDMDRPYSSIKCEWGDMFFVPPDFAFYAFAACRVKRSGEKMDDVILELKDMIKRDALSWSSENYSKRKGKIYSWQNIHGRDIRAIFEDDLGFATKDGKERIKLMSDFWPEIKNLSKIHISGPNNTNLFVLANPTDYSLFNKQVRKKIEERTEIIEKISYLRGKSINLLDNIPIFDLNEKSLFDSGTLAKSKSNRSLKVNEIRKLEQLVNWLDTGERALTHNPF